MPGQLTQVAQKMLGAEANMQTLGDALKSGKISMQEFNNTIVDMNANGSDGFSSFAQQAQENSNTIQTGITNIQSAFARFWETVFKAMDGNDAIVKALKGISGAIDIFAAAVGVVIGSLLTFGGAIADVISKLNEMGGVPLVIATLIPTFVSLWAAIRIGKNLVGSLVSNIGDGLPSVLKKSSKNIKVFGNETSNIGQKAGKSVGQLLGMAVVIASIGASIWLASNGFATLSNALTQLADKGGAGIATLGLAGATLLGLTAILATLTPTMASAALPMLVIGGAIAIMSLGFSVLVIALTQLAQTGPAGIAVLAIAGATLGGLIGVVALLTPALAAAAIPMLAVGVAVGILATGVGVLVFALASLCQQLPIIAEYGLQVSGVFISLGASLLVFGSGALIAGAGAAVLAAGLFACSIPIVLIATMAFVAGMGMMMLGTGAVLAAAGCTALSPFLGTLVASMAGLSVTGFIAALGIGAFGLAVGAAAVAIGLVTWMYENFANAIEKAGYWSETLWHALDGIAGASSWAAINLSTIQGCVDGLSTAMQTLSNIASSMNEAFVNFANGSGVAASGFQALLGAVVSSASGMSSATQLLITHFNGLLASAQSVVEGIKSAFANMQLYIPSPTLGKMPHFKMSGKFNTETGEVPTIDVDWYAKGGVFKKPQIIGVGDASSPEIVSPEDKMRGVFESVLGRQKPMEVNTTINTNDPALAGAYVISKIRRAF